MADVPAGWTVEPAQSELPAGWTVEPAAAPPTHGRIAEALHKTASYLPMAGGIAGGALGAAAGAPTGPGAFWLGALGAGALGGAGKGIQHLIDTGLGYEQPMGIMDAAKDTGESAGGEALGAGVGGMAAEVASAVARPLSPLLRNAAIATTRRILRNTGGSLSASIPLDREAAQEVLDMGLVKPFGTSGGAAERLSAARAASGDAQGKIVRSLEGRGFSGPEVDPLGQQYVGAGEAAGANSMNPAVPRIYESAAEQLATKPTVNGALRLSQAEQLKRSLQDQATSAYKQLQPNEVARAHEEAASMMRQAVEDQIAKQAAASADPGARALAAQFEPIKQQTGRLIAADNVAQAGMARAANRHAISPADIAAFVGEQAHSGNPIRGAGAALLMHLARTRGPSTAATALNFAANRLEDPASNILVRLGAGGGSTQGQTLLDLLEQIRQQRAQTQSPAVASQ